MICMGLLALVTCGVSIAVAVLDPRVASSSRRVASRRRRAALTSTPLSSPHPFRSGVRARVRGAVREAAASACLGSVRAWFGAMLVRARGQ